MDIEKVLYAILDISTSNKYPDVHLNSGYKPYIRKHNGDLEVVESLVINGKTFEAPILDKKMVREFIIILSGEEGLKKFEDKFELDSSYKYIKGDGDRYRINCYMDSGGYSIAMRIIPSKIPTLDELGLGKTIANMCDKPKGLILVTGPTGSGKSTNLAAMIDYINKKYKKHIITIEDPIEFAFKSINSLINQREIGNHTKGFQNAMKYSLREDPDIIMVGEMRDPETIRAAITLAETGHLVLSTLHTNDTVQTVDRIIDVFPSSQQGQIRMQLAMSLVGVISQRLITDISKKRRIAVREVLLNNNAVRNLIIEGKTHQLYSVLEVGAKEGMILMDKNLVYLYNEGLIDKETLISFAREKDTVEMLTNR